MKDSAISFIAPTGNLAAEVILDFPDGPVVVDYTGFWDAITYDVNRRWLARLKKRLRKKYGFCKVAKAFVSGFGLIELKPISWDKLFER